jgi:hypothetical protein
MATVHHSPDIKTSLACTGGALGRFVSPTRFEKMRLRTPAGLTTGGLLRTCAILGPRATSSAALEPWEVLDSTHVCRRTTTPGTPSGMRCAKAGAVPNVVSANDARMPSTRCSAPTRIVYRRIPVCHDSTKKRSPTAPSHPAVLCRVPSADTRHQHRWNENHYNSAFL